MKTFSGTCTSNWFCATDRVVWGGVIIACCRLKLAHALDSTRQQSGVGEIYVFLYGICRICQCLVKP